MKPVTLTKEQWSLIAHLLAEECNALSVKANKSKSDKNRAELMMKYIECYDLRFEIWEQLKA